MFLGRNSDLQVLHQLAESSKPELFVLYGRRRVGKTELLQQFCRSRRAVYFLAAQVREKDNLRAFKDALVDGIDDPLAANIEFPDWGAALTFAAERAKDERLVVVLDEFPYLCDATKGMPSLIQRFWDTRGKHSRLMLVLCGSQVSFMEREVLAERSPLFGRRTAQKRLEPLAPAETLSFFTKWKMRERVLAYAILGGMPAYLRRFEDSKPLLENVARECLRPEGYLFDEVSFLLRTELSNPATYNSLLAAIARGNEKVGDIALDVGIDSTTANKYLTTLRELSLVDREVPITDPDPLRSRRGTYRVADRFVAFHFRHIQPHASLVHAGRGARVLEQFIEPDLERLYDEARTDFVLAHMRMAASDIVGSEIVEAGRVGGTLLRAVARTHDGGGVAAIVAGDAKASVKTLEQEIAELKPAFGDRVTRLGYRMTNDPSRPLDVKRLAPGEMP